MLPFSYKPTVVEYHSERVHYQIFIRRSNCIFTLGKMFLISFLLTFSASGAIITSNVESATHDLSMSRANGPLLSSHSLHHSSVRGLTDCVQLCLRHIKECSFIAYDKDSQMCDVFASKSEYQLVTLMFPTKVLLYTSPYRDCTDVKQRLSDCESGVYQIKPCSSCDAFLAYCDMDTDGKAWTVFQRRQDGSVDFNQDWQNHTSGFGDLSGEFWLGNNKIHKITSSAKYKFRIDMVTHDGNAYHVTYESIEIGSEAENFRLDIGEYIDTKSTAVEGLDYDVNSYNRYNNGMSFSTIDRDNDFLSSGSCSIEYKCGWWFNMCYRSNLNGEYKSGIIWDHSITGHYILRFSEMKMRRIV
ncbi:fibrinogen-like protein A [Anneissia japonica]|uniref:fibrinogen-like protein A n=1 Tax=Anneissia japonica TaxID=1529436 RepID=UPI001425BB33|nr:fibrinogen-like protein A [Anneissia japonica]